MIQQSHSWAYNQTKLEFKKIHAPMFIAAVYTIAKTLKQPKCPSVYKWKKMWYIYICTEILPAIKKNETMSSAAT